MRSQSGLQPPGQMRAVLLDVSLGTVLRVRAHWAWLGRRSLTLGTQASRTLPL